MLRLGTKHSFGEEIARRETADISCSVTRYFPNTRFPTHTHERPGFHFIVRGQHRELRQSVETDQPPGTLTFFDVDSPHGRLIGPQGMIGFNLSYNPLFLEEAEVAPDIFRGAAMIGGPMTGTIGYRMLASALKETHDVQLADAALAVLLPFSTHEETAKPSWLTMARDFLDAEFRREIGLRETARAVGINAVHLAKVFRRHYGCSTGKYLQMLRLMEALRLVESEALSIGQAAAESGFSDQAHLSKICKREIGASPKVLAKYLRMRLSD